MWCMLSGRKMEAKLNPSLTAKNATLSNFAGLPERERPIVACAYRDFILTSGAFDGLRAGVGPVLERFGCARDAAALRDVHRVARDYYAYGIIFPESVPPVRIAVTDPEAFFRECFAAKPELAELTLARDGRPVPAYRALLDSGAVLRLVARPDAPLDDAFALRAEDGSVPESTLRAARALLSEAGTVFSEALYAGYRRFKSRLDGLIGEGDAGTWLAENGVEVYVRGQSFNLVATRPGTVEWWASGSRGTSPKRAPRASGK